MLENRIVNVPRQKCMPFDDGSDGCGEGRMVRIGPAVRKNVEGFAMSCALYGTYFARVQIAGNYRGAPRDSVSTEARTGFGGIDGQPGCAWQVDLSNSVLTELAHHFAMSTYSTVFCIARRQRKAILNIVSSWAGRR